MVFTKFRVMGFISITFSIFISSLLPFFRSYPKLIGEPFDTRFQIVVHEHWYWFLKGERPIRDVYIFYPFDTTLGFSDIFLMNGVVYSLLRYINFSILDAWTLTNFIIIFIGNIGFSLLLINLLKSNFLIIAGIFTFTNSYAFIAFLDIWPNTVGYALVSWTLLILYKIYNSSKNNLLFWFNSLLVFLPILSLTFWYPGFFSILGTFLFFLLILLRKKYALINWFKILTLRKSLTKLLLAAPIWLSLWILFVFITLPTRGNLRRSPDEIYKGSLEFNDFFSINLVGPTFVQDFLQIFIDTEWSSANEFWAVGYPLLTLVAFLWVTIQSRNKIRKLNNLFSFTFVTILFSILLTTRVGEFGIYILLWQNFEFLGIIRTPVRVNIIINFLILLLIFKHIDQKIRVSDKKTKILSAFVIVIIILDQFRILKGSWDKQEFINRDLSMQQSEIQNNCKYFVLVNEGAGHWSDTIEGMVLSSLINVPTINGYSGTFPADAIKLDWDQPSANKFAIEYINRNQLNQKGCILSNSNYSPLSEISPIFITDPIGSSVWESSKKGYWLWFTENQSSFKINNPFDNYSIPASELLFKKAPCLDEVTLEVKQKNGSVQLQLTKQNPEKLLNFEQISPNESIYVEIESNQSGCLVGEDPRPLIYALEITK
jgi:hypothetical protein